MAYKYKTTNSGAAVSTERKQQHPTTRLVNRWREKMGYLKMLD